METAALEAPGRYPEARQKKNERKQKSSMSISHSDCNILPYCHIYRSKLSVVLLGRIFSDILNILYVIMPWCLCLFFRVIQRLTHATVVLSPQHK